MGNNKGIALIITLWIMVVLILLAAGIAMMARTETHVSRNYSDVNRCKWAARAGVYACIYQLKAILSQKTTYLGEDPHTVSSEDMKADLSGYTYTATISDEAGKININTAEPRTLQSLFGSSDVADSIVEWRTPLDASTSKGTDVSYYSTLNPPYKCKSAPFETVRELQMVKGITAGMLSSPSSFGDTPLVDLLTVYAPTGKTDATGSKRVDIQSASKESLQSALGSVLGGSDIDAIISYRSKNAFHSPSDIAQVSAISRSKIEQIYDKITVSGSTAKTGLVNINTAPKEVLAAIPGMDISTAQSIVDYRSSNGAFAGVGYLLSVNDVSSNAFASAAPYFTVSSTVFKIVSTGKLASTGASATITCVAEVNSDGKAQIRYWQE